MSDVLAVPAVVLAGITRMPFGLFISVSVATSILKSIVIVTAGYLISKGTDTTDANFVVYGFGGVFLVVLIVVFARFFYAEVKKSPLKR